MLIRKYRPGEEAELWHLFRNTVRNVNIRDYTVKQVQVWAPDDFDEPRWLRRIHNNDPWVCVERGQIVGFADLQESGNIDLFYVHHQAQGKGVGKLLFAEIEKAAARKELAVLTADVSFTARAFFESRGFRVVTAQEVKLGSETLLNFRMMKRLQSPGVLT